MRKMEVGMMIGMIGMIGMKIDPPTAIGISIGTAPRIEAGTSIPIAPDRPMEG
ncbi:MAG TPA: hypothetical protein VFR81_25690 [Longimicrobium sp.]|nr:hypothetical protein [Longimicrobium sp.]